MRRIIKEGYDEGNC